MADRGEHDPIPIALERTAEHGFGFRLGLRVKPEEERYGLDLVEHGMWGYPEQFMPVPGSEYHQPAAPAQRPTPRPVPLGLSTRTQEG